MTREEINAKIWKEYFSISPEHYYVYTKESYGHVYDRTCGTKEAAKYRIAELESRGRVALYSVFPIKGAFV